MNHKLKEIFNIENRTVLITGAAGYLGRYMARTFLDVGANVALMSRSEALKTQVENYNSQYGSHRARAFQVDCYDRPALDRTLETIAKIIPVDVIINNAYDLSPNTGFNTPDGKLETSPYQQWQHAFESGIYWAVRTTQVIGETFIKRKSGSIINISSMYGIVSPDSRLYEGKDFFNPASYGVNKAGIIALTRYTAAFWGKYGIRCNAVAPGTFPNVESSTANSVDPQDDFLERLKNKTVLGRLGHPDDLSGILIYLACDASSYVTGQTISVDGGWTIT